MIDHIAEKNIEEVMLDEKMQKKKKRFLLNTVELILGIIFLYISFQYIKTHPAEKISVFSSMSTFIDKIHDVTG